MRKLSLLITFIGIMLLVLTACSKEAGIEKIKVDKPGIRGIVQGVEPDTFTIESRDRIKQGRIVVTKRVEIEGNEVEVNVGDTITVYHESIEGSSPARINRVYAIEVNKEATPEEVIAIQNKDNIVDESEEMGYNDVDYYEFPNLTVINDGNTIELTEQQSAITHDIINSVDWEEGAVENFNYDYEITDGVETTVTFNSETHTLNDEENDISVVLYEGVSVMLKDTLDQQ